MSESNNTQAFLCRPEECIGCMACYNACMSDAIVLAEDSLKTLLPKIDAAKCVSCRKCSGACPVLNPVEGKTPIAAFAAHTLDGHDVRTCASGGIAAAYYRLIISLGGCAVGVTFDAEGHPCYAVAHSESDLESFKGSKYVFVHPQKIYRQIKAELDNGKPCFFVGTPCHVDALKHYLNRDYDQLITADLICHGTPPYAYLEEHICAVNKKKREVTSFSFRGEHDFSLTLKGEDRVIYQKNAGEDYYFRSFLDGLIHRKICYSCPYAGSARVSDMTIGDFWGAPEGTLNHYAGRISAVLINTGKGMAYWEQLSKHVDREPVPADAIIAGNAQLRKPSEPHPDRSRFEEAVAGGQDFMNAVRATSVFRTVKKARLRSVLLWLPRKIKHLR